MRISIPFSCLLCSCVALALGGCGNDLSPVPTRITEYSAGFTGHPGGLVPSPDGNLWFTEQFDDKVGVFNVATKVATEFDIPRGTLPHNGIVGPDGNLWFTGLNDNIGTFNFATRAATIYRAGITPGSEPHVSLTDPTDPNLIWFTEQRGNRLGRFDRRTAVATEFDLTPESRPHGMILGPDNRSLLFCQQGDQKLAMVDLSRPIRNQTDFNAQYRHIATFSPGSGPHDPLIGPDGRIYVTLQENSKIGRFNSSTGEVTEFATTLPPIQRFQEVLPPLDDPNRFFVAAQAEIEARREIFTLIGDPDTRSIWFNEFISSRIGRYDMNTTTITESDYGMAPGSGPLFVVLGPDKHIWFTEVSLDQTIPGRIARLGD